MEEIRFIPVLEKTKGTWSGRIIAVKSQGEDRGRRPTTWTGISHPLSGYRVSGEVKDIEQNLHNRIKSFFNHDESSS
jgi:hypothetical protein